MAQQKSEDRVVPDGGVMPVQPGGSSLAGQGKAVSVILMPPPGIEPGTFGLRVRCSAS
jgi:hypothetical protein